MILTGSEIKKEVLKEHIKIFPFEDKLLNPNSYNYRLSNKLVVFDVGEAIDIKNEFYVHEVDIPEEGFVLNPNRLYLGSTYESIGSDKYVPSLIGRSSLGRLGLFLQITADLGHLGTYHAWTLELKVVQPLRVYPFMRIGQVSFWLPLQLKGFDIEDYRLKKNSYANFSTPQICNANKFY